VVRYGPKCLARGRSKFVEEHVLRWSTEYRVNACACDLPLLGRLPDLLLPSLSTIWPRIQA
jgi:hypothetical protein